MSRSARRSRPQLVCVVADNSSSMYGDKAGAATKGIREMLMRCQSKGPAGVDRSYFQFILIRFSETAEIDELCSFKPVRHIDPSSVSLAGDRGATDITAALEAAYSGLEPYVRRIDEHPERNEYPVPLVLLFSDGQHNGDQPPEPVATRIKSLTVGGAPVLIATAAVATDPCDAPDIGLLQKIASSPACCVKVENTRQLSEFLAAVGSSVASSLCDLEQETRKCDVAAPPSDAMSDEYAIALRNTGTCLACPPQYAPEIPIDM